MNCIADGRKMECGVKIKYTADDKNMTAEEFTVFADKIWQGDYDEEKTKRALSRTLNITARDGDLLVGSIRILTDGYFFGTITELLVLPEYQGQGIGSRLLELVKENTPTVLYFGAKPGKESFYEKNGCKKSMQSYVMEKDRL